MKQLSRKRIVLLFIAAALLAVVLCVLIRRHTKESAADSVTIGIAWRADTDSEFYTNIVETLEEAGVEPVLLDQVITEQFEYVDGVLDAYYVNDHDYLTEAAADIVKSMVYADSNVTTVMNGVDAVIFTGGEDISPTLCADAADWHGIEAEKDYNATRDVSDYILMSYCIDQDIPVMGFCRGMQMISVVSGASIIQDLPSYYANLGIEYDYTHRNEKFSPEAYRDYAPHDVTLVAGSRLQQIYGNDTLEGVPSWHHQAVGSVEGTALEVTAYTDTLGVDIVEGVERTDKTFVVGLQFHPEAAVVKHLNGASNAGEFLDKETALRVFRYFIDVAA